MPFSICTYILLTLCRAFKDDKDESDQLTCNTEKDKGVRLHHRTAGNPIHYGPVYVHSIHVSVHK